MKKLDHIIKNRGNYYYKIILNILIISVFPSLIVTFIFSQNYIQLITIKAKEANTIYLEQMSNSLEIAIDNILDFSKLLSIDDSFSDYVRILDKEYFEDFSYKSKDYTTKDFKRFYEYLKLRGEIYSKLDTITLSNPFIDSIYFYDTSRKKIFKNGKLPVDLNIFEDKEWLNVIKDGNLLPYIMPSRFVGENVKSKKNVISIIFENITDEIPFVINIDTEILYKKILDSVNWNNNDFFFILSKTGDPLLYSSENEDIINHISILSSNVTSFDDFQTIYDKKYMINSLNVTGLGWTIYSVSGSENLTNIIKPFKLRIFLISLIFFIISLFLVYFLSKRLYSPINKLSKYAGSIDDENVPTYGDLTLIQKSLNRYRSQRLELKKQFEESLPSYKKDFFAKITNNNDYKIDDITERLQFIKSDLQMENLGTFIILADFYTINSISLEEKILVLIKIQQLIIEYFFTRYKGEYFSLSSTEICVIYNLNDINIDSTYPRIYGLMSKIKEVTGFDVTIGLGTPARTIFDLPLSFTQATDSVKFRTLSGTGQLIYFGDMDRLKDKKNSFDPGIRSDLLKEFIKTGNLEEATSLINEVYKELTDKRQEISFISAKHIYLSFVLDILSVVKSNDTKLLDDEDPVDLIFKSRTLKEVNIQLCNYIIKISRNISVSSEIKKNENIDNIISFLNSEYGQDINLNIVADKINLNPSYVSRLFKENMNISFIDYLTDIRIKKAIILLHDSELRISQIAEEVGYFNSNYFIRLFKKKTGHTPGEHRKLVQ
ncbi:MAG: helix-turn-helix domain-containing protein [Spirochaetaceae bacterium]